MQIKVLGILALLVLATGCTTITPYEESHQAVLFRSSPPGAKIYNGKEIRTALRESEKGCPFY